MTEKRATERREVALPKETSEPGSAAPDGEGDDCAPAWEGYSLETLTSVLDS
jgi:hypothetical protein